MTEELAVTEIKYEEDAETLQNRAAPARELSAHASAAEVLTLRHTLQQVYGKILKKGIHFQSFKQGATPSLLKPGAEAILTAFRIAPYYQVEDLSTDDQRRYRVLCTGRHLITDKDLGQGVGECSSDEEKYKWRQAVCKEEYEAAPATRRREKWKKAWGRSTKAYKVEQVRTEIADQANTVLKMAKKRAYVDMCIALTGCSDLFTQDLEDMPDMNPVTTDTVIVRPGDVQGSWTMTAARTTSLYAKAEMKGHVKKAINIRIWDKFKCTVGELKEDQYNEIMAAMK